MRGLGYRVVDMIVAHHLSVRDKPVVRRAPRAVHDTWLAEPIPRTGREPEMVLDLVEHYVLTGIAHTDHPRFFGYVPPRATT
jgi:aromatic-L-amino-acid decarboxylase